MRRKAATMACREMFIARMRRCSISRGARRFSHQFPACGQIDDATMLQLLEHIVVAAHTESIGVGDGVNRRTRHFARYDIDPILAGQKC